VFLPNATAAERFFDFFTANIRNKNTRRAYYKAACRFAEWCEGKGLHGLAGVKPVHVAAYIEGLAVAKPEAAGIKTKVGNHSLRATGITDYLKSEGTLEHAQAMANHSSPRTTKLYDRRSDDTSLDEYEKVGI
jgi:integrase